MKVTLKADWGDHKKGDDLDIKDKTVICALVSSKLVDKPKGYKADEVETEDEPEVEGNESDKTK